MAQDAVRLGPEPEPNKTRGKKAKIEEDKQESQAAMVGLFAAMFTALFGTIAMTRGEHWNLKTQEATYLGHRTVDMIDSWPGVIHEKIKKYAKYIIPTVAFNVGLSNIVQSRFDYERAQQAKNVTDRRAGENAGGEQSTGNGHGFAGQWEHAGQYAGAGYR